MFPKTEEIMIEWLAWFIYSLIPAIITVAAHLSMQTMTILYFVAVAVAMIFWTIRDKRRARASESA